MTASPAITATPVRQATLAPTSRIAAWMHAGMLDWPGRVAVTVFMSGCGFHCPFCHNPDLVEPTAHAESWPALSEYLDRRRAWIDGVVVTGGEPTSDPRLKDLLREFARRGLPVKLDTNGSDPELLGEIIAEGLVEYVALDVKTTLDRYPLVCSIQDAGARVLRSIRTVIDSGVDHEFRTTVYPQVVSPKDLPRIAAMLAGGRLLALQQFRPDVTLSASASRIAPVPPDDLHAAARACADFIPTITRGV